MTVVYSLRLFPPPYLLIPRYYEDSVSGLAFLLTFNDIFTRRTTNLAGTPLYENNEAKRLCARLLLPAVYRGNLRRLSPRK